MDTGVVDGDVLPTGYQLHEYRFVKVLGQGAFGVTYRAEDTRLQHFVAIKEFLPTVAAVRRGTGVMARPGPALKEAFDQGLRRFLDEARTLARFRHPNVVRVQRFIEGNGTAYMVMDFEAGVTFADWLSDLGRPPAENELRPLLLSLLDGLGVVHAANILHRDIKPANILVRADGTPVLLDFGAARHVVGTHSQMLTTVLTPGYAPFEQYFSDGHQGPWTDIYALGAVLYRAVTGGKPPEAPARLRHDFCVPAVTAARGRYTEGFLEAIDWALKRAEEERPQTLAAWRAALDSASPSPAGDTGEEATVVVKAPLADREEPKAPALSLWRRPLVVGLPVLAILAGGMGYLALNSEPRQRPAPEEVSTPPAPSTKAAQPAEAARIAAEAQAEREAAALREQMAALPRAGAAFRDCPDCPELVVVPAGIFTMGSPASEPSRGSDEGPQDEVRIGYALAVGKVEVTFAEWDACVAGGGCKGYEPGDQGWGRGRRPVINVSWDDAQAYVAWLSEKTKQRYRLLSESEWEYAARAGTTTPFNTGEWITPAQANFDGNGTYNGSLKGEYRRKTADVGSFPANAFGLHDMHGNVWEWVEDCWSDNYQGVLTDGMALTTKDCKSRVLRGGSWNNNPLVLRSAIRDRIPPDDRYDTIGFRVARTITP